MLYEVSRALKVERVLQTKEYKRTISNQAKIDLLTSLDPALPGSIMRREGSNISRCKPFFGVQLLKQGLHLEIFDPSQRMIELVKLDLG